MFTSALNDLKLTRSRWLTVLAAALRLSRHVPAAAAAAEAAAAAAAWNHPPGPCLPWPCPLLLSGKGMEERARGWLQKSAAVEQKHKNSPAVPTCLVFLALCGEASERLH